MVYLHTSDEWQRQTSLLLQARPTTTRITTKYNIPNLDSPKYQRPKKRKREDNDDKDAATSKVPRAFLTLKTFCPESGVTLKFKTDRAAEVGRLIAGLGRAGRLMAALPAQEAAPEVTMEDAPAEKAADTAKEASETKQPAPTGGGGGGGGKKKKKGKK